MNKLFLIAALALTLAWSDTNKPDPARDAQIHSLQQDIQNLERIKLEKAKKLEDAEAKRWDTRYRENAEIKTLEDQAREWDGTYGRLADEVSKAQEEVVQAKNAADQAQGGIDGVKNRVKAFNLQVSQSIDKISQEVAGDFPVGVTQRTQNLSQAKQWSQDENSPTEKALQNYFGDRSARLNETEKVEESSIKAVFPDRADVPAWRMQLGTIFLADIQKEASGAQLLLRTGTLQGQLFSWKTDLRPEVLQRLQQGAQAWAGGRSPVDLPMDVLQNGGISRQLVKQEQNTLWQSFQKWFSNGGLVMWPLMFLFLLSLSLTVERGLTYWYKSWQLRRDSKVLLPHLRAGRFEEAFRQAEQRDSALARITEQLLHGRSLGREWAEKSARQVLLREIPFLEKRLPFIQSLGTTAPLLGLLGTVSGMVTLFSVITEVGTNDTRILSSGISEALVATEAGLLVAIPTLLLHGLLTEMLDTILSRLKESSMETMNLLHRETVADEDPNAP